MKRVFLLGAGFSRGFHPPMPLMRDLAVSMAEALGVESARLSEFDGDLEAWLSYLSTRQPWDDEPTSLRNLATFREASGVIANEIERVAQLEHPETSRRQGILERLALDWCVNETAVLTFNYDLLVEHALLRWDRNITGPDIYPLPLTSRQPAGPQGLTASTPPITPLPSLYKLHGSVNWLYPGIESSDGPITLGPWNRPDPHLQRRRDRHLYSDLTPLVVPPTSSKSSFYGTSALRSLWAGAADALRRADELVVIGYSFPASDQQVTTLIRTTLPEGTTVRVVTADETVPPRVTDLFPRHVVDCLVDDDAAASYVDLTCGPVIEWSHAADTDGVREWLRTPLGETTRMANYSDPKFTVELGANARDDLSRAWPTVTRTWRGVQPSTPDVRNRYHAYVPKSEWQALQKPWELEAAR